MVSTHDRLARLFLALAGFALAACLTGCGAATDAGTVAVTGTVTVDGRPLTQASVAFIGREGARMASATTDNSGKFNIRAALGKNVVTVAKAMPGVAPPASDEPQLMPAQEEYKKMAPPPKSEVPDKYADPKTSGLSVDVVEGIKAVEFALSTK